MPDARRQHVVLELPSGDVVVVGGLGADATPMAATARYDLAAGTWSRELPLPSGLENVSAVSNGDLRVVAGRDADDQSHAFRWVDGTWSEIAAPPASIAVGELWAWGEGIILLGYGELGRIYDPGADTWTDAPTEAVSHPDWETDFTPAIVASALIRPNEAFILTTTAGAHPEIAVQVVPATLTFGDELWSGGTPGVGEGSPAYSFAPGWVLVGDRGRRGDVYDANSDAWCRTAETPQDAWGPGVVLDDGSVLFAGGACDASPLLWNPWS